MYPYCIPRASRIDPERGDLIATRADDASGLESPDDVALEHFCLPSDLVDVQSLVARLVD